MKAHTTGFKNAIKTFGRELDSKITYDLNGETIELGNEQLNSVSPHYEGAILKSVMRQLDIDSREDIPLNETINYRLGVKVNDEYEYINFGNYVVYSSEKQEDTGSYKIICYDKMLYSMRNYDGEAITYPITIRDYIDTICGKIGVTFENLEDTFPNYNKVIPNELYNPNEYKFRDVLDELAQVTASTICINEDDRLELRYITDTEDTIDEEFLKDINVNFGEKYGPVNSIVLSRSAGADNVYLQDDESVSLNGLTELKILDNQIMNFNDRDTYLPDILDELDGLEYYVNDFSSTGIGYYNICDKYNVSIGENTYSCIMFNDEINITQGLEELIQTNMPEETETDYSKADKTDRRINQTNLIVNKQEGYIKALTTKTEELEDAFGNVYTKTQTNELIQTAATGVTNTFSEAGGNNVLRNTRFFAQEVLEQGQVYEYWYGNVAKQSNSNAANGISILLQDNLLYQTQNIANGNYTLSFYYKILNPLATCKVIINGVEYELTSQDYTLFQTGQNDIPSIQINANQITVGFSSTIANACEIYDIMLNAGTVKLAYSQNQNETITNTVNISRGITIDADVSNVRFAATPDGIRIRNKATNDIVTYFTDSGTSTDNLKVNNSAEIVGIYRQKVGDQIWDSMI